MIPARVVERFGLKFDFKTEKYKNQGGQHGSNLSTRAERGVVNTGSECREKKYK